MDDKGHFPTLDLSEFWQKQDSGSDLLYHEIVGERFIEKPHKHDFFLFMLFENGNGTHTIDFTEHQVAPFQLHMLFPEQIHKWDLKPNTRAQQIMMSKGIFETLASSLRFSIILYQNHPVINLSETTFKKMLYEFKQVEAILAEGNIIWEIIEARIKLIALMISQQAETLFDDTTIFKTNPILVKYLSLIEAHFKTEKLVSFYAEQLNISANYLNILCKRNLNASATSLIHERLILEMKRMLLTTEKPIKSIAFELSFFDVPYFSKFFKKYTGVTPNKFRGKL
ncbi:helix-turn-helix transcriptional regulator [Pedobacter aquatilis]|uniref:AraC family transcriptional regulator n=1 Tax=Pedobacter aquatilis TaxID=351343 RepID=UPI0029314568|nr:helix-turn-helix transcriptional regulator [Pedobacter aquatilis]